MSEADEVIGQAAALLRGKLADLQEETRQIENAIVALTGLEGRPGPASRSSGPVRKHPGGSAATPRQRGRRGQRTEQVFEIVARGAGVKAAEVAGELGITGPNAHQVLRRLREAGRIRTIGGRSYPADTQTAAAVETEPAAGKVSTPVAETGPVEPASPEKEPETAPETVSGVAAAETGPSEKETSTPAADQKKTNGWPVSTFPGASPTVKPETSNEPDIPESSKSDSDVDLSFQETPIAGDTEEDEFEQPDEPEDYVTEPFHDDGIIKTEEGELQEVAAGEESQVPADDIPF